MRRSFSWLRLVILAILAVAILGGITWANVVFSNRSQHETHFLVPWLAARTFLQYGDSPYGDPASQRAQVVYYGRLATQEQDPLRLDLPFPEELFYFIFAAIPDYAVARGIFMTILEAGLVALGILSLRLAGWKPGVFLLILVIVLSVLWVCSYIALIYNRGVILAAAAAAGSFLALREKQDELAGALMVGMLATLTLAGILLIFMFWWLFRNRRYRVIAGFLMTLVLLLALSFFLQVDWFFPFLRNRAIQANFNPGISSLSILRGWLPGIGLRLGWALTAILLVLLFVEWRAAMGKDFRHLFWTICLSIACMPWMGFSIKMDDLVILVLPIILFLSIITERWSRPGKQWLAITLSLAMFLGTWTAFIILGITGKSEIMQILLTFGVPLGLIAGLYWMRWWVVNPPRTWRETI